VANVTTALATGLPFRSMVAFISAVSVEFAVIMVGAACTKTSPAAMFTTVDADRPCQVTLTVAFPGVMLGVRVTFTSPPELVVAV